MLRARAELAARPGRRHRRQPRRRPPAAGGAAPHARSRPRRPPAEPRLDEAGLAIDALGALVDGLGDRLAPHDEALRDAVSPAPARVRRRSPDAPSRREPRPDDVTRSSTTRSSATPRPRRSSADDGSIDWLCVPRFDSGACFAALLGDDAQRALAASRPAAGGRATRRRYRDGTLVLETEFDTPEGTVRVIDCMPVRDQRDRRRPDRRGRQRPRCR